MGKIKEYLLGNVVTLSLCLLFVIIFFLQKIDGFEKALWEVGRKSEDFHIYRLFTCIFLHFGIVHLLGNIVGLLAVGSLLEHKIGRIKFLLIYLLCGFLSEVLFIFTFLNLNGGGGGASGCIFGLIGALVAYYLIDNDIYKHKWYRIDLYALIVYAIVANVDFDNFFSFSTGSIVTHAFGFIIGVLIVFFINLKKKPQNNA